MAGALSSCASPDLGIRCAFGCVGAGLLAYAFIQGYWRRSHRFARVAASFFGASIFLWTLCGTLSLLPRPASFPEHALLTGGAFFSIFAALSLWALRVLNAMDEGVQWKRIFFAQAAILTLLASVVSLGLFIAGSAGRSADHDMRLDFERDAIVCARTVNAWHVNKLSGSKKDFANASFQRLNKQMEAIASTNKTWTWAYVVGTRNGRLYSFVDSLKPGDPDGSPSIWENAPKAMLELLEKGRSGVVGPYLDRWGSWISAAAPIYEDGSDHVAGLFCVDIDAGLWSRTIARERIFHLLGVSLLCVMLLAGIALQGRRGGGPHSGNPFVRYAETIHIGLLCLTTTALCSWAVWRFQEGGVKERLLGLSAERAGGFIDALLELRRSSDSLGESCAALKSIDEKALAELRSKSKRLGEFELLGLLRSRSGAEAPEALKCDWRLPLLLKKAGDRTTRALDEALSSGLRGMIGPFRLKELGTEDLNYLLLQPLNDGRSALVGLWRPQELLASSSKRNSLHSAWDGVLRTCVFEKSGPDSLELVAAYPPSSKPGWMGVVPFSAAYERSRGMLTALSFFGRQFFVSGEADSGMSRAQDALSFWIVLASGLALSFSLTVLSYIIQGGHRRAEELVKARTAALLESQERFHQVSEQSREMIWEVDAEGLFTYVNKGSEHVLGLKPEDLIGKRRLQEFCKTGAFANFFSARLEVSNLCCEITRADKTDLWISRNALPLKRADGSFAGFRGLDFDVSDSKRAEALSSQQASFLQDMMDAIPNPVYYKTNSCEYLGCNKAFENFVGIQRDKIVGLRVSDIFPPEFARNQDALDRELVSKGGVQVYETVFKPHGAPPREVLFSKAVFRGADGKTAGFIGVIIDISERKRIESERMRNEAHLDSLLRLSQFHSKSLEDLLDFALEQALRLSASPTGFIFVRSEAGGKYNLNSLLSFDGEAVAIPEKRLSESPVVQEALRRASHAKRPLILDGAGEGGRSLVVPVSKGDMPAEAVLLVSGKGGAYDNSDALQLSLLMESIWKIYERNVAEENVRQDLKSLGIILNILHMAMEDLPLKSVLGMAISGLRSMSWFNFTDKCSILLMNEETGVLESLDVHAADYCAGVNPDQKSCLCLEAASQKRIVFAKGDDPRHCEACKVPGVHTHCAVPIFYGQKLFGVINLVFNYDRQLGKGAENFLQALAGVLAVIIQRRRSDEELRRAHESNKTLIESIPTLLITIDRQDRIVQFNPAAERILRKDAAAVLDVRLQDSGIEWDFQSLYNAILSFRGAKNMRMPIEVSFKREGAAEGYLRMMISAISGSDASSGDAELLLVGTDVSEQRALEAQLLQAQKLEAIGQLAAGIAHEINTPTQYIGDNLLFLQDSFKSLLGFIEKFQPATVESLPEALRSALKAASEEFDLDFMKEESPKAIQQALEGVSRISDIVHAMKEFSHPGAKGKSMVDLNKALANTATVARNEWKYVADLKLELDPGLPPVPCLPGEMNQVFLNLIVNAAHAIGSKVGKTGEKGLITIITRSRGEMVEICVDDSGCGIPDSIKSRIFEPFFTTKAVGKGTGQGLSIARGIIVNKHGGELFFQSEQGKGTSFFIRLPVKDNAPQQQEEASL